MNRFSGWMGSSSSTADTNRAAVRDDDCASCCSWDGTGIDDDDDEWDDLPDGAAANDADTTVQLMPPAVVFRSEGSSPLWNGGGGVIPPPHVLSSKVIDQLVNEELLRLSLEDREQALQDVHGVSDQVDETPAFVYEKLRELDEALKRMVQACQQANNDGERTVMVPTSPVYAYSLACQSNLRYVEDNEFRLRFLRADQFDVGKAAQRMVSHFASKLEYFGREMLSQDIRQEDLEEQDLVNLRCGSHQLLPSRDRAGRAVTIWIPRLKANDVPLRNKMRSAFYSYMDISKSDETQRKGYVDILYLLGAEFDFCGRELAWKLPKLIHEAIPLRLAGNHICYDKFFVSPLIHLGMLSTGTPARLRLRSHYGSHATVLKQLQSFGIPIHVMPFDERGVPCADQSRSEWEKRRRYESMMTGGSNGSGNGNAGMTEPSPPSAASASTATALVGERVTVPGPHDVLLGRGRNLQNHPGNRRFRMLIDRHLDRYDAADKQDKTILGYTIVRIVHEMGGRFLRDVDGAGYVEVDDDVARPKVAHCFRSQRSAATRSRATTAAGTAATATATSNNNHGFGGGGSNNNNNNKG